MAALNLKYIQEIYQYLDSGDLRQDFQFSCEERRFEILEFLEKLMDLGELSDKVASEIIFRNSRLGLMSGGVPGSSSTGSEPTGSDAC